MPRTQAFDITARDIARTLPLTEDHLRPLATSIVRGRAQDENWSEEQVQAQVTYCMRELALPMGRLFEELEQHLRRIEATSRAS